MGIEIKITGENATEIRASFAEIALAFGAARVVHDMPGEVAAVATVETKAEPVKAPRSKKTEVLPDPENPLKANGQQKTAPELGRVLTAKEATALVRDEAIVVPAAEADDGLGDEPEPEAAIAVTYDELLDVARLVKRHAKLGQTAISAVLKAQGVTTFQHVAQENWPKVYADLNAALAKAG